MQQPLFFKYNLMSKFALDVIQDRQDNDPVYCPWVSFRLVNFMSIAVNALMTKTDLQNFRSHDWQNRLLRIFWADLVKDHKLVHPGKTMVLDPSMKGVYSHRTYKGKDWHFEPKGPNSYYAIAAQERDDGRYNFSAALFYVGKYASLEVDLDDQPILSDLIEFPKSDFSIKVIEQTEDERKY